MLCLCKHDFAQNLFCFYILDFIFIFAVTVPYLAYSEKQGENKLIIIFLFLAALFGSLNGLEFYTFSLTSE